MALRIDLSPYAGKRVCVALSGGADSVALFLLLREGAERFSISLSAVHVEHGIRGEQSLADTAFVRELCAREGVPLFCFSAQIPALAAKSGRGLEEEARAFRYAVFARLIREDKTDFVATAHHAGDNAESVLFHLFRGASLTGAGGVRPFLPVEGERGVVRPLLEAEPAALRQLLRESGIAWAEDASNGCDDFLRVRIRKFLPELEKKTGISIRRLAETARALRMTREYLEAETDAFVRVRVRRFEGPAFSISPSAFARLHPEIGRRVLSRLIKEAGGRGYPPEYRELRRLAERLQNPLFAGCTLGGCEILPFMKRWWVIPEAGAKRVSGGRKADLPALSGGRTAVLPHKLKRLLTAAEDDC